jgi:hypothetical protein
LPLAARFFILVLVCTSFVTLGVTIGIRKSLRRDAQVFESARHLESYRHLDIDAAPPFDGPAGLGFIVFAVFLSLFCLLWYVEFKIQRAMHKKLLPQFQRET